MFKISTLIMKNSFHNILKYRDDLIWDLQHIDCRVKTIKLDGLYQFSISVLNFQDLKKLPCKYEGFPVCGVLVTHF